MHLMSELVSVPLELVDASPDQNRTVFDPDKLAGLAQSILANGLLTPIVVRRAGLRFVLVAGERRTRAARSIGLSCLPAHVIESSDHDALIGTLVENVSRDDPDPIDEASGYRRAIDAGETPETLAGKLGVRVSRVRARLALLELGDLARERVRAGELKLTYAAAMVGLDANRQPLALHAYAHVPTPPIDAFRLLCDRMRDDQAAEGMDLFATDGYLKIEEWVAGLPDSHGAQTSDDPVGVREIAAMLAVKPATVHKLRERHADFPAPAGSVSGTPYWVPSVVTAWAESTGRLIPA
jgi:ParB family chromosome partitioning protein